MGRRLGLWLLLLVAAVGLLVVKRESVADGWLRIMLPAFTAAERERADALAAFGRERFAVAAQSDDPRKIAAAARYQNWVERPRANLAAYPTHQIDLAEASIGEIDGLVRRAATQGADDPVVWSQLAQICEHGWGAVPQRDCPAEAAGAIERLAALEPDNGWSVLLALDRLHPDDLVTRVSDPVMADAERDAAIETALTRLAASTRVDGHEAAMLKVYRRIFDGADWPASLVGEPPAREVAMGTLGALLVWVVAPPGWVVIGHGPPYASAAEARDIVALQWLITDNRLLGGGFSKACRGELSEARLAHCRRAAVMLSEGSNTMLEAIGSRVAIRLAPDPDSEAAARAVLRQHRWRQHQFAQLADPSAPSFLADAPSRITGLWIETGREGEAYARLLAEQGLATTPPPGWTAPGEELWGQ